MMKKLLGVTLTLLTLIGCGVANAQNPMEPLPINPKVKTGVLPNGLTYYVLHNEEPKGKANFYIAQKVGSTLENQDQLGLAHFLEHMAFNGTKNYPGKKMLEYLQSKGIRFGADINAYTGFDETVYNIDNIPTSDDALVDSVLLVLRDWSCDILLEDTEIDNERKVIQEEWRAREGASMRYFRGLLPAVYQESQYHQLPIGSMDVVMNFPYQAIKDYYHKWYRPDQQGIVVVGDFDADAMEAKIVKLFSSIVMPEDAAPRVYAEVADNDEPIYFAYQDKEAPTINVTVSFKEDKAPREMRNTLAVMMSDNLKTLITMMLNERLHEYGQKADCPYVSARVGFGNFLISSTKDAFDIDITAKTDAVAATKAAMEIVAQAMKTGFTDSEYTRAKDELLANYEKMYNERDKTRTSVLAREIIRHFVDNEAMPGIEKEYEMLQALTSMVDIATINQVCGTILTPGNQVITLFQPEKDGSVLPTREAMLEAVEGSINKTYEAYVDDVITEPLVAKLPKVGKIKKKTENATLGTTEYILSNNVKVIVKSTDFAADQILMTAIKKGGKETFAPAQASNCICFEDAISASNVGSFDRMKLNKYLAGKQLKLNFSNGNQYYEWNGETTVKDLNTFMELLYANFTLLKPNKEQYDTDMAKAIAQIKMYANMPQIAMQDSVYATWYNHDPRVVGIPSVEAIESADYDAMYSKAKSVLSNAADYTFIFTGNIDAATFEKSICQYIATLPAGGKSVKAPVYPIKWTEGEVNNVFKTKMATPSTTIYYIISQEAPYDVNTEVRVRMAGQILGNIYTNTIREEVGGAYSPHAQGDLNPSVGEWFMLAVIQTNAEQQQLVLDMAKKYMNEMLANGVSEEDFSKVKGAMMNQYDINLRKNNSWDSWLTSYVIGRDKITGQKAAIENLTLEEFNAWLKGLYNGKNALLIMQEGVAE